VTRSLLLVVGLVLASCTATGAGDATYDLTEFSITGPDRLADGVSTITAHNSGEFAHTLVVTTDQGVVVAATDLIQPGDTIAMSVDLPAGMFQITCRIVAQTEEGRLIDHYEAGMNQLVDVNS